MSRNLLTRRRRARAAAVPGRPAQQTPKAAALPGGGPEATAGQSKMSNACMIRALCMHPCCGARKAGSKGSSCLSSQACLHCVDKAVARQI